MAGAKNRGKNILFLALFGALGVGALTHGCNTYDKSLLEGDGTTRPPTKNGIGWWSKNDSRGCFSAGVPTNADRPAPKDGKDIGPIMLAVASMRFGSVNEQGVVDQNAWQDIGFDIDGVCTASETCPSEDPPPSCKAGASALPKDGNYCRDNTFGKLEYSSALVPQISKTYGLSDDAFNCSLCVGDYTFLIRVTGYNGEANDDNVRIDLYPSPGLEKVLPWDCSQPTWVNQPCFTPDMPWTVLEDTLVEKRGGPDLPDSKIFDSTAYVRESYVVVHLPEDVLFWFPGYKSLVVAYPLRIQKGIVVGKLQKGADNVWSISDGVIAGRAKSQDLLNGFRLIGFCDTNDKANYDLMTTFISDNLDVRADGTYDSNAPCDALSLGIAFSARQAKAGKLETVAPLQECIKPTKDAGADGGGVADSGPTDASDQ